MVITMRTTFQFCEKLLGHGCTRFLKRSQPLLLEYYHKYSMLQLFVGEGEFLGIF